MSGEAKKVFIKTFGCPMYEYDSDKMVDVLRQDEGYEPARDNEQADQVVFNTEAHPLRRTWEGAGRPHHLPFVCLEMLRERRRLRGPFLRTCGLAG